MGTLEEIWKQALSEATSQDRQPNSPVAYAIQLAISGILAIYIRWLFRRFSATASNADSISRVFPLLTIITTSVIGAVESSLAIALGMVGALSIVRFRAAIKEPEELVYLFFCIAIGLALGAQPPTMALTFVAVASIFVIGMHFAINQSNEQQLLLTIIGDADRFFADKESGAFQAVKEVAGKFELRRFHIEDGVGELRVQLPAQPDEQTLTVIQGLRERLPDCEMSYANLGRAI